MDAFNRSVFLAPGDYFVGDASHQVRTLLGSCVSITLWHPARRLGAMSHFLLAGRHAGRPRLSREALDPRYGPEALALMLQGLAALGVSGGECEAKLFGGGSMFPGQPLDLAQQIGRNNGDVAVALLQAQGLQVVSCSLFGVGHRKIVFDIATGDVWARREERDSDVMPLGASRSVGTASGDRAVS